MRGRRIAVIGDMLELGPREREYHYEVGRRTTPQSIDVVIAVGPRSEALLEGARHSGFSDERLYHFPDAERAGAFLQSFIQPGDLVLIKASRGIGLDKIVTMLLSDQRPATSDQPVGERG